jgi:peptidoglycan/LPS O-acetylase OafA/YrhL
MIYRAEIDGLRAVAVLPVILFHAHIPGFEGGYVGVDIFFVISGFLITNILLTEISLKKFTITKFYERRIRRIFPALFFMMAITFPFAYVWQLPSEFVDFSESIISIIFFVSNILFFFESDYFSTAAELKPLLHTWSLAIEEQYYVVFPILLILIQHFKMTTRVIICGSILLFSLALAHWASSNYASANFYLLPTRAWELLIGSLAAFLISNKGYFRSYKLNEFYSILGVILIIIAMSTFDKNTRFPSLYALLPTIGTALILIFAIEKTIVQKILKTRFFVAIGLISYSLYLWHQPILALGKQRFFFESPTIFVNAALLLLSVVLAIFSWKFIENPFRNSKRFSQKVIFILAGLGSISFLFIGVMGTLDYKEHPSFLNKYMLKNFHFDNAMLRENSWSNLRQISHDESYGVDNNLFDNQPWFNNDDIRLKVLLVGNSHSKDVFNVLNNSTFVKKHFQLARYGSQIRNLNQNFINLPNYRESDIIIITSHYQGTDLEISWLIEDANSSGKRVVIIRNIIEIPMQFTRNLPLVDIVVRNAVDAGITDSKKIKLLADKEHYKTIESIKNNKRFITLDAKINSLQKEYPFIYVLDRLDYMCDKVEQECFSLDRELNKYYYDYAHHTLIGAEFFGHVIDTTGWLEPLISLP